ALDRDQVDRLLDDADDRPVAARVLADRAELFLGQVPALIAEADSLLDLLDRPGERERLVLRRPEQVKSEPVRGARAHARVARPPRGWRGAGGGGVCDRR